MGNNADEFKKAAELRSTIKSIATIIATGAEIAPPMTMLKLVAQLNAAVVKLVEDHYQ